METATRNRKRILLTLCGSAGVLIVLGIWWMVSKETLPKGLEEKARESLNYARQYGLNEHYCLLLDYSIPSGSPGLFVWSFEKDGVIYKAHAMHGPGKGSTNKVPVFSNETGSLCSSVGRFLITKQHGRENKSGYFIKGLDNTNSNAFRRSLMIHGSRWVDSFKWKRYIPLNKNACQGCVSISNRDMTVLSQIIEEENEPLLLWSYCSEQ